MEGPSTISTTTTTAKIHALVIPWPRQGHINPLMRLSKKLSNHGFLVTFVHTQFNLNQLQSHGVANDASSSSPRFPIRLVGIPDGLPLDHPRTDVVELASSVFQSMEALFEELVGKLVESKVEVPVTCVIFDFYMRFAPDVAKRFGIPSVAFFPQSAASLACQLLVAQGYRPPQGVPFDSPDNIITRIPGIPPLKQTDMVDFLQSYDPSNTLFDMCIRPFQKLHESSMILLNSFERLEADTLKSLQKSLQPQQPLLLTIGPLQPSINNNDVREGISLLREDEECISWLDSKPPSSVLYIAFGSNAVLTTRQVKEILMGIEASGVTFLWVVHPGLLPDKLDLKMMRVGKQGNFVKWAPQLQVLHHPSVGGFLSHCGWNSTLESVTCGVPMLGWPYYGDQMLNCRCIVDGWHLGLSLDKDMHGTVRKEEVEMKVRILMSHNEGEGKIILERAQHIKNQANMCILEGGSSHEHFNIMNHKTH